MEGLLRSIIDAGYPQLQGRGLMLVRYDPLSDSFPDEWRLVDGEIARRYSTRINRSGMTARILHSGQPLLVNDVTEPDKANPYLPSDVKSFVGAPVVAEGVPWGVLFVNSDKSRAFSPDDIPFVEAVARQIGATVHGTQSGGAGNVELSTVRVLAATVDAKDHYTRHHSTNVSFYARILAREMNLDPAEVRRIDLAGMLHDIGKIAIPDQTLQKPGPLTFEERLLVQTHASIGANILAQASHLQHLVPLVRHHHEFYDGTGYPDGLKGDEIPLGAAILNLADSFDTMTTRRVYRAPRNLEEAMQELRRCTGTQFSPDVVAAFERLVQRALANGEPWAVSLNTLHEARSSLTDVAVAPIESAERPDGVQRDPLDLLLEARLLQHVTELPVVVQRAAEQVMDFWSADAVQFYLADETGSHLQLAWSGGPPSGQPFLAIGRTEAALPMTHGLCGWAAMTNQGLSIPDARRDPRWEYPDVFDGPVSVMVSPVSSGGNAIGVLQVVSRGESRFGLSDLKVMKVFGALVGHAVKHLREEPASAEAQTTDPLTGLRNANYLRNLLEQMEQSHWNPPLSIAFLDGDGLKEVNDRYGHEAGDHVIRHIARCLGAWRRSEDVLIRFSGDEFVVCFGGLSLPEASAQLERIRMTIAETPVELPSGRRLYVSVSCGVTEIDAVQGPHQAVRAAEQAMYNAKRTGKNRIWTAAG
jgi:diguanylate cyclase (GGDEF)-like protein/putative nucleotidyltransferase with HDIG domain